MSKASIFTAKDELCRVLDEEHAQAFIEHRQRLRKPMTAFAAKLIAQKLAQVSDPNKGVEIALERGWIGFEKAWYDEAVAKLKIPAVKDAPSQAVMDKWNARSVKVSNMDAMWSRLPKRFTDRDGYGYFTPEEVASAKAEMMN